MLQFEDSAFLILIKLFSLEISIFLSEYDVFIFVFSLTHVIYGRKGETPIFYKIPRSEVFGFTTGKDKIVNSTGPFG